MISLGTLLQSADWKTEKHIPAIEAPKEIKKGDNIKVRVVVGAEISHPNTTEHYIDSIDVFFKPDDENRVYVLGHFDFKSHGASVKGANTSTIYTDPDVTLNFKTEKSGTIIATSFCNIHGLWENSWDIKVD